MQVIDGRLPEGWYGYRLTGIDLFGRHSPKSAAAAWWQWAPPPDPHPWYYRDPPGGELKLHPSAIRLLDTEGPPAPTGTEAYALDPLNPPCCRTAPTPTGGPR